MHNIELIEKLKSSSSRPFSIWLPINLAFVAAFYLIVTPIILANEDFDLYRYLKDDEGVFFEPASWFVISALRQVNNDFLLCLVITLMGIILTILIARTSLSRFEQAVFVYGIMPFILLINFRYGLATLFIFTTSLRASRIIAPLFHWIFIFFSFPSRLQLKQLYVVISLLVIFAFMMEDVIGKTVYYLQVEEPTWGIGLALHITLAISIIRSMVINGDYFAKYYFILVMISLLAYSYGLQITSGRVLSFAILYLLIMRSKGLIRINTTKVYKAFLIFTLFFDIYIFKSMTGIF
jgi:hypothetical protein